MYKSFVLNISHKPNLTRDIKNVLKQVQNENSALNFILAQNRGFGETQLNYDTYLQDIKDGRYKESDCYMLFNPENLLIGSFMAIIDDAKEGKTGLLDSVSIVKAYQNKNYALDLIVTGALILVDQGVTEVFIEIPTENVGLKAILEKIGFIQQ